MGRRAPRLPQRRGQHDSTCPRGRFTTSTTLLDQQATAAGVVAAIGSLAAHTTDGDLCLITYSGHGGQIDDISGDEDEGQDETWVLFDRQLLDDELHVAWSQFPAGVRVLVVSDSCHSGSVTRDDTDPRVDRAMPLEARRTDNDARRAAYKSIQTQLTARGDVEVAASVLLISGCQDDQVSYDGVGNGAFTQSLLETWSNGTFDGDYPAFHHAIVDNMTAEQTPNLNDTLVADPTFLTQRPFMV